MHNQKLTKDRIKIKHLRTSLQTINGQLNQRRQYGKYIHQIRAKKTRLLSLSTWNRMVNANIYILPSIVIHFNNLVL